MISVIIPVYNEEKNVPRITRELTPIMNELGKEYEIVLVDDGSTDSSKEKIQAEIVRDNRIRCITHETNKGLGCAIRTAIDNTKGEIIIALDADFTFHPRQIPLLYDAYLEHDADCVIGSFLLRSEDSKMIISYRLWLSKVANKFYQWLLPENVTAVSSIFRLYKADAVKDLQLSGKGFDINAEILFKMIQDKRKITEVPAVMTTRLYGKSKLKTLREIRNHLKLLYRIIRWKLSRIKILPGC